ncbi:MAG: hypothetical protein ACHP7O_09355 [Burkholderiales bacterium]
MRFSKLALIFLALELAGCAPGAKVQQSIAAPQPDTEKTSARVEPKQEAKQEVTQNTNVFLPVEPGRSDVAAVKIEKVAFQLGLSSSTVEKLAKQQGCSSSMGAGLITDNGPVEIYRVNCQDGSMLLARCELRQCNIMKRSQ